MPKHSLLAALLLASVAVSPATATAQASRDATQPLTGPPLRGVPVSAELQGSTRKPLTTMTDAAGSFEFRSLEQGNWRIRVGPRAGEKAGVNAVRAVVVYGPLKTKDAGTVTAFSINVTSTATDIAPGSDDGYLLAIPSKSGGLMGMLTSPPKR